jgi:septation ring formation regulator EzrA
MKKLFLLLAAALIIPLCAFVGDDELKRPKNIGDSSIDNYVNEAFDIYEGTLKTDKDLAEIDSSLTKIEKNGNKLKQDAEIVQKLYNIQGEVRKRQEKIREMDSRAAAVMENAKNFSPKLKAPQAIKNVNNANKALKIAQEKTPGQLKKTEELTARADKLMEKK